MKSAITSRITVRLAPLLLIVMVVSGCGAGSSERSTSGSASTGDDPRAAAPSRVVSPLGSREAVVDDGLVRLTVSELRRSAATVVLDVRLEPVGVDQKARRTVSDALGDGSVDELVDGDTQPFETFDGPYLVDPVGRRKYLVALDASGSCVCSNDLGGVTVGDGPVHLQATLTAPPPGVTTVDLSIPRFGTFQGVELDG